MKSKLIIFIVTIFSVLSMSFNEIKYQEFSTDDFTKVYVTKHPSEQMQLYLGRLLN